MKVSLQEAYRIRRWFRRLAKMRGRGHLRRLTVFIRYENGSGCWNSWGIGKRSSRVASYCSERIAL